MIPLIETLEINLWMKFLIDATMKSVRNLRRGGVIRIYSASSLGGGAQLDLEFGNPVSCLIVPLFSLMLPQWEVSVLPATSGRDLR